MKAVVAGAVFSGSEAAFDEGVAALVVFSFEGYGEAAVFAVLFGLCCGHVVLGRAKSGASRMDDLENLKMMTKRITGISSTELEGGI